MRGNSFSTGAFPEVMACTVAARVPLPGMGWEIANQCEVQRACRLSVARGRHLRAGDQRPLSNRQLSWLGDIVYGEVVWRVDGQESMSSKARQHFDVALIIA